MILCCGSVSAFSFDDFFLFFSVFQTNAPNITDAYVSPLKVAQGDVMSVSAEVSDDFGVSFAAAS